MRLKFQVGKASAQLTKSVRKSRLNTCHRGVCVHICLSVYVYIYIYICVCVHIYIYIYALTESPLPSQMFVGFSQKAKVFFAPEDLNLMTVLSFLLVAR